jgi:taurine dioxygenase
MAAGASGREIVRVSGSLGAEIRGVDLRALDDEGFAFIHRTLLEHEVVFFRDSGLDDESQLALAARFGAPSVFPLARLMGRTEPGVQPIEDGPDSPNAADAWHTDVTWIAEPPKYALLRGTVVPERGGDTMWASMTAAYQALSPEMQQRLCRLKVHHDNTGFITAVVAKVGEDVDREQRFSERLREHYPGVDHPLIRTHPETGRRAILYGGTFMRGIVGMTGEESDAILEFLAVHVDRPEFQCRWHWQENDLAIWDERSTIHRAVNDHFPQRRTVRRCEVDGDRPYFDPNDTPDATLAPDATPMTAGQPS